MKEIRNDRLNLRIRPDERDLIEEAAALEGTTISEMLRRLACNTLQSQDNIGPNTGQIQKNNIYRGRRNMRYLTSNAENRRSHMDPVSYV